MNTNILPIIDLENISQTLLANIPHDELLGQLIILKGQFLFIENKEKKSHYKFLSSEAVEKAFTSKTATSGWLPSNTVWWGRYPAGEAIIQFYPPNQYSIELVVEEETKAIAVPMPAFLFAGCSHKYYLWAFETKAFNPSAQLYKPPLPNIQDDSSICFGQNSPPMCSANSINKTWELFWNSPFNRDLAQYKSKAYASNICNQLVSLHEKKAKSYPSSDLLSFQSWKIKTPEDVINNLFN